MKENNEVVQGTDTVGAVLSAKTKENKIQEVKQAIAKVAEKKAYKLGAIVTGKQIGRAHV